MSEIDALILGIIQGLTEFLPVSSSGHLKLGAFFLNVKTKNNLLFSVMVHAATALSTIVIYRKDIGVLLYDLLKFKWNDSTIYVFKLAISMIPVGIVGVFFEDEIESLFSGNVVLVAFMLFITGILLTTTYFYKNTTGKVTWTRALIMGVAQAIAVLPGISRSGATISTGIISGADKSKATRFSFLMVLAPILGASLLKVKDLIEDPSLGSDIGIPALIIGFAAAFVSGLIACQWMIKIVRRGKLIYFAIYCFVISIITLIAYW